MNNKRVCIFSGGGAWSAYGCGVLAKLNKNYDIIIGISTGNLIVPFIANNHWDVLYSIFNNINNNSIYDISWYKPLSFTEDGKIKKLSLILSILLNNKTIHTTNNLKKLIDLYFTSSMYDEIRLMNKEVLLTAQNYAESPSKIHFFSSLYEDFNDFKDWMWCGGNIPLFTSLISKGWKNESNEFQIGLWGSGILTTSIGINQLLNINIDEIDIILNKPKNIDVYEMYNINNIIDNIFRTIHIVRYDIETDIFFNKIKMLNKKGVRVMIYWLPRKLNNNPMYFNSYQLNNWWNEGYDNATNKKYIDIYNPIDNKKYY